MSLLTSKEERQIFVVEEKDFNPSSETSQDSLAVVYTERNSRRWK